MRRLPLSLSSCFALVAVAAFAHHAIKGADFDGHGFIGLALRGVDGQASHGGGIDAHGVGWAGLSFRRAIEADGPFLLVDRCSFGDPSRWVSLVLGGHGRRGDHRVPEVRDGSRWERHAVGVLPWRPPGGRSSA